MWAWSSATRPGIPAHGAPRTDVDTGAVLALSPLPGSPARTVAGGRDGILTVWNVTTAERVERPLHGHDGPVRAIRLVHRDRASPLLASADGER
jgi:WD40 repeat protein